jgi:acetylornithine deacetylase/succinyl-diaminopimelate desuccinylase-like protein
MIVPGESCESAKQDLEALIAGLDLDAEADVELVPPYYPPLETDRSARLFQVFDEVFRDEVGIDPVYGPSTIITDASVFGGEGRIPTLVFGPTGGGIHQANEYVDPDSLDRCARIYTRTALRLLADPRWVSSRP